MQLRRLRSPKIFKGQAGGQESPWHSKLEPAALRAKRASGVRSSLDPKARETDVPAQHLQIVRVTLSLSLLLV